MSKIAQVVLVVASAAVSACESPEEELAEERAQYLAERRDPPYAGAEEQSALDEDDAELGYETRVKANRGTVPNDAAAEPAIAMSIVEIRAMRDLPATVERLRRELAREDLQMEVAGVIPGKQPIHMFVITPPRTEWPTLADLPMRAFQLSVLVMMFETPDGRTVVAYRDPGERRAGPHVQAQGPDAKPMAEVAAHGRRIRAAIARAAGKELPGQERDEAPPRRDMPRNR